MRSTQPAYQKYWRHCKEPAGPLGRCDLSSQPYFLTCSLPCHCFFALFLLCLILIVHCYVLFRVSLKHHSLLAFFLVAVPLSLSSLTFPSISVIFYLARTEATGMRTCLYDTWLLFCAHWFVMFVSLFAAVSGFPSVLPSKLHINAWHIRVLPSHLLFMYMFIYVHGGL